MRMPQYSGQLVLGVVVSQPTRYMPTIGQRVGDVRWSEERSHVTTINCADEAEARAIAEQFRAANGGRTYATWQAETEL